MSAQRFAAILGGFMILSKKYGLQLSSKLDGCDELQQRVVWSV